MDDNIRYYDYDGMPMRRVKNKWPEIRRASGSWFPMPLDGRFDIEAVPISKKRFEELCERRKAMRNKGGKGQRGAQ